MVFAKKKRVLSLLICFLICEFTIQSQNIDLGLVGHWSFDNDTDSLVIDDGPNSFDGIAYNIKYENGKIRKSVVFDNPEARILIPDINKYPPDSISKLDYGSISVWFKFKSIGAQILPIIYFGESTSNTPHHSLIVEIGHGEGNDPTNKRLYFTIVNQAFCYHSKINLSEDIWYNFVAVVSRSGNTGYLNGKEMLDRQYNFGSDSTYTDFFNDVPQNKMLSIGYGRYGQEDPFYSFNGSIDDVRIYNRPLGEFDAYEIYSRGSLRPITENNDSDKIHLNQNYPNPFTGETVISWQSDIGGFTTLEVFDGIGQKIATLANDYKEPGKQERKFDSESLPSGIYYYQLRIEHYKTTNKMIIMN